MKKTIASSLLALLLASPVMAQTTNTTPESTPRERLADLFSSTVAGFEKAGRQVSDLLGAEAVSDSNDIVIDGVRYMPLVRADKYQGSEDVRELCKADFVKRYPQAKIQSIAIPHKDWIETMVKRGTKITAYRRSALCYIIARDGDDGYIQTRYIVVMQRKAGQSWKAYSGFWPRMDRTDVIPQSHFSQLK